MTELSIVHGGPLTSEPYLGPLTISGFVREVTDRFGESEAIVMWAGDERIAWSYADLWQRSVAVAKALIAGGMGRDARIGVLMTNRPEYLASVFGIALAGGVTVSLSTFATPVELEHMLQAGDVAALLYDRQVLRKSFSDMLAELEPAILDTPPGRLASTRFPFLKRLVALDSVTSGPSATPGGAAVESWSDLLAQGRDVPDALVESRAAMTRPSDLGAVFFSSGTTGLPKGIVHAQRAFAIQWWRWRRTMAIDPVNHPVRCWTGNGFFWSGNISQVVGYSLATGGTAVLQPVFDADDALTLIERERVSFAIGRPHQWARLQASDKWPTVDLSSLHYVTYGEKIFEHPTVQTDWQMRPAYGNTETLTINTAVVSNTPADAHSNSYGQPLPGNILKIFDPLTGRPVARGERGEIAIKGPTLMIAYIGKTPEETFDEEGYFCTGDGGYVDEEGYLYWEGRLTDMIKTGGANVSPVEVDEALAAIPGIKRAQTVGIPHETLGEMVVACVIPHAGEQLSQEGICTALRQRLASFKIPRAILFLTEEEFPVTGSEKVKTSDLRDLASKRLEGVKVTV